MARPSSSEGIVLPDPITYDAYNRGYKSGAQTSLFIGPVWVEEAISVQINSQTSDIPIYGYSNPYYGDILLGNYQVAGQIAVSYTEPDYLLRIINNASQTSIREDELAALIENRKSIFLDTVKYRLITEARNKGGQQGDLKSIVDDYAVRYVERITREVETRVLVTGGTIRNNAFELTIITGNLESGDSSIEIYEGIKIIGTGKVIGMDDSALIEAYQFIGRKKPDRRSPVIKPRESHILSKSNLMSMAREVASSLVNELLKPPAMDTSVVNPRTVEMLSTDKIAIAGQLPRHPRFFGKPCSFAELSFTLEYPQTFGANIKSTTSLKAYKRSQESDTQIILYPPILNPDVPNVKAFDNKFGRLVSPDRTNTAKHVTAVAPIEAQEITKQIGGSIALPRFQTKEFVTGSYYPPEIVDVSTFDYTEDQLDVLTAGTLWCNTIGFRSSSTKGKRLASTTPEMEADDSRVCEVSQPLNTMAIVDGITSEWEEDDDTFKFTMNVPRAVDYISTNKGTKKVTQKPIDVGQKGHTLDIRMSKSGSGFDSASTRRANLDALGTGTDPSDQTFDWIAVEGALVDKSAEEAAKPADATKTSTRNTVPPPGFDWKIYENSELAIFHEILDVPPQSSGDPITLEPHYFELVLNITEADLAVTLNKTLYITPFVFVENDTSTIDVSDVGPPKVYSVTVDEEKTPAGVALSTYFASDNTKTSFQKLAYFMKSRSGTDSSCDITVYYDCVVSDQSGYYSTDGRVKIYGIYFLKTEKDYDTMTATDGTQQSRRTIGSPDPKNVHVFWFASVVPILQLPTGMSDQSGVEVTHTIEGPSGRYLEIYNITRCDTMIHNTETIMATDSGIWEEIKTAIVATLQDLLNVDSPITSYTFPMRTSWGRFAGFLRGYSLRIEYGILADQIANCSFSTEGINAIVGKKPDASDKRGWTLSKALSIAEDFKGSGTTTESINEITSLVSDLISDKIKSLGGKIIENDSARKTLIVDFESLLPAKDVVTYGLTEDGLTYLKGLVETPSTTEIVGDSISLGGYEV